jgi:splicing factor 3B subunit 3
MLYDELPSLSPIVDMKVLDATIEGQTQIYTLCGRGPRSTMRVLRHGLGVSELASSELHRKPMAVWSVKKSHSGQYHQYIIVSFVDVTLVMTIGKTVEEVKGSGFLDSAPTLLVQLMADDSYVRGLILKIRIQIQLYCSNWRIRIEY